MKKRRVVILGGGFGGLTTALALARRSKNQFHIVLIDREDQHLYTPWLYKVPADALLRSGKVRHRDCHFMFKEIIERFNGVIEFRKAEVRGLNRKTRHVLLDAGKTVQYDYLVFALGAEPNFYGIPGMKDAALLLQSVDSVREVYKQFGAITCNATSEKPAEIVVVGGGATGTEAGFELAHVIRKKRLGDRVHLRIVNAGPMLLERFNPYVQNVCMKRARNLGVHVHSHSRVTAVKNGQVYIQSGKDQSEQRFNVDLLLWGGGGKPSHVAAKTGLHIDERGRISVDGSLAVHGEEGVFALGDSAAIFDEQKEQFVPPTAWAATDQGVIVARNIIGHDLGHPMTKYIPPVFYPGVTALGGPVAAGGASGINVKGFLGYMVKVLIHLKYFLSILPPVKAVQSWVTRRLTCDI